MLPSTHTSLQRPTHGISVVMLGLVLLSSLCTGCAPTPHFEIPSGILVSEVRIVPCERIAVRNGGPQVTVCGPFTEV